MTELAFISLGSNIEPERNLPLAIQKLRQLGKLTRVSAVYQNPAVDRPDQPDFLNAAVLVETELQPSEIRRVLRQIESELGRIRTVDKFAPRTIDLDLCLLGETTLEANAITLPDPDLLERAYLAVTMAELSPKFRHPTTGETLKALAERLRPGAVLLCRKDVSQSIRKAQNG